MAGGTKKCSLPLSLFNIIYSFDLSKSNTYIPLTCFSSQFKIKSKLLPLCSLFCLCVCVKENRIEKEGNGGWRSEREEESGGVIGGCRFYYFSPQSQRRQRFCSLVLFYFFTSLLSTLTLLGFVIVMLIITHFVNLNYNYGACESD